MSPSLISAAAFAAVSVSSAAAASPAAPTGPALLSLAQVVLALAVVIAAIFASAWLMRRLAPGRLLGSAPLRVVGGVMVGAKERVVVVELQETWLVLGVTAAQITPLHTLPKPQADPATEVIGSSPFADRLAQIMGLRKADREIESVGEQ